MDIDIDNELVSHDAVFKSSLEDVATARDFFASHLPEIVKQHVDLTHLVSVNTNFMNKALEQRYADILYQTKIDGHAGYLYLLVEHQSQAEPMMPIRVLEYCLLIMKRHYHDSKNARLPIVIPLLIYTGKTQYPYSLDIFDLFAEQDRELARQAFMQPATLIDLSQTPDSDILQHKRAALIDLPAF